jgi:hypothetical protein
MVQLLPLLEAVRDHPLPSTQRQDERRIKNEKFPESQERAVSHVAIDRWAIVVRGLRHDPQQGREGGHGCPRRGLEKYPFACQVFPHLADRKARRPRVSGVRDLPRSLSAQPSARLTATRSCAPHPRIIVTSESTRFTRTFAVPGRSRVGPPDHLVLSGFVGDSVADLKLHRQDAQRWQLRRFRFLLRTA